MLSLIIKGVNGIIYRHIKKNNPKITTVLIERMMSHFGPRIKQHRLECGH